MSKKNPFREFAEKIKEIRNRKPPCPSDKNAVITPKSVYSRKKKHKVDYTKEEQ